jgi:hypothetical protein
MGRSSDYEPVEKRKTVVVWYVAPGFSSVEGKAG